jgi:hypothetical protein
MPKFLNNFRWSVINHMEPRKEFFQNRGIQAAAYILLFAEVVLIAVILWYFIQSRGGTFGDLGGAAMNLVFGIPLGVGGLILAFFAQKKHPAIATVLGLLSLVLVLQIPTFVGEFFIKSIPAAALPGAS